MIFGNFIVSSFFYHDFNKISWLTFVSTFPVFPFFSLSVAISSFISLFRYPFPSHPPSNPPSSFSLFYGLISCAYPSQNYLFYNYSVMVIFVFEFFHNTFLYDTSSDYSALFPNRILVLIIILIAGIRNVPYVCISVHTKCCSLKIITSSYEKKE